MNNTSDNESKLALAVHKAVRKGTLKTIDIAKLLKKHLKQDKFALRYLRNYLSKKDWRKVSARIKQNKASISIERKGYSFLISGRDLLPVVHFKKDINLTRDINAKIEQRFSDEKRLEFSNRAWEVLPEYISPKTLVEKRLKILIALALFSPELKINILDKSSTMKRLISHAELLGKLNVRTSNRSMKSYDLNVKKKSVKLGKFREIAESAGKVVHLRKGDMDFLESYIAESRDRSVEIPKRLEKSFRKDALFELAKASARMELRATVKEEDIARVKQLNL